ncbi:MAG: phosphotransferase [Candidatus Hydrogenedentes bacterium]|nr:phosphotransferase [Candidatus Hydrogenedentota bacterium]
MSLEHEALGAWGLSGVRLEPLPGGTANRNLLVTHSSGRFVLRQRSPRYADPGQIAFDHALMRRLADCGIPGPRLVLTPSGAATVNVGGALFELHAYVPGEPVDWADLGHLRLAARTLRRFHEATAGFDPPSSKAWGRQDAPETIREGLRDLRRVARDAEALEVLDELECWAVRIAEALPDSAFWALPCQVIHGDFHPGNVNIGPDGMRVFDLDCACRHPRVRDLADGILYFCARRDGPFDATAIAALTRECWLDPERNRVFLDAYGPLTPAEQAALPWVVAARWIDSRVRGRLKLPRDAWPDYAVRGVLTPLDAVFSALPA